MKAKLHPSFVTRRFLFALVAALTLCRTAAMVWAQADTVTISAAEFQRMVYSAHLQTQLKQRPELDAALTVLLELHRRNPQASPSALAAVVQEATARYRTNTPAYICTNGYRDEILAVYLDSFRQVSARTNFVSANLALLNYFVLKPDESMTASPAEQINAGAQRLLTAETAMAQREQLLDQCMQRASGGSTFGAALDMVIGPETWVLLAYTPLEILAVNPALQTNVTILSLLARTNSSNGSVTISTNDIKNLFGQEMIAVKQINDSNMAVYREILQTQTDLPSYLTNTALIAANVQREDQVKEGHAETLAAGEAAVHALTKISESKIPEWAERASTLGHVVHAVADGLEIMEKAKGVLTAAATGSFISAGLELVSFGLGFMDTGPSPEEQILEGVNEVKDLINELSQNMNYRFDRVDQSFTQVLDQLDYSINLIGFVEYDVDQVRQELLDVQSGLHRLERELYTSFNEAQRSDLVLAMNGALFYEYNNPDVGPMPYELYNQYPDGPENTFYTYAIDFAEGSLSSPANFSLADLAPSNLREQLEVRPLDANLNYIKQYLSTTLGLSTAGRSPLSNPRDWFTSASAYLQLAAENPMHFRKKGQARVPAVISHMNNLTDFLRSLTFSGTNINWPLYSMLVSNYYSKLDGFVSQVHATEQQYADVPLDGFALQDWRNWAAAAPRITSTSSAVQPLPLYLYQVTQISAGGSHSLALKNDGTVVGWGYDQHGEIDIPASATNVVAIAAGGQHSLALRADGMVVGWGLNSFGQATGVLGTQPGVVTVGSQPLSGVRAIAAGDRHSLALKTDGTIVVWGDNSLGQTNLPAGLTNIMSIAAGYAHSLGLNSNGTVVSWGRNNFNQTNVPVTLSGVRAIAAGGGHSLALKTDGTVVGWGSNDHGQTNGAIAGTNVMAIAAAGSQSLALSSNSTVVAWGDNSSGITNVPAGLSDVAAIAVGYSHALALKADGTAVGWGSMSAGQSAPPGSPPGGAVAVAGGGFHSLALRADGTVVGWGAGGPGTSGNPNYGQSTIPNGLSNVVAVAASGYHSLALKSDGTVIGWGAGGPGTSGDPNYGQSTIPDGLTNVVAIVAGPYHSLALKADGTVRGWGRNDHQQANGDHAGNNVVAIAAGWGHSLALKADGTVFGWGYSIHGEADGTVSASDQFGLVTLNNHILTNVVRISAGNSVSEALLADGGIQCWGWSPNCIPGDAGIAMGDLHSLSLSADGQVSVVGDNTYGQLNEPAGLTNVVAIAAGSTHSLALKADGTVVAWGAGAPGSPGNRNLGQSTVPSSLSRYESYARFSKPGTSTNTTANAVSHQFDGHLFNGPTWATGIVPGADASPGKALSFHGIDDYVMFDRPVSNNFTLECWFRTTQRAGSGTGNWYFGMGLVDGEVPMVVPDFGLSLGDGLVLFGTGGTFDTTIRSGAMVADGQWHHVAATRERSSGAMRLYVDGHLEDTGIGSTNTLSAPAQMRLGGLASGGGFFQGDLDDVRMWNVVRTPEQIVANMRTRLTGTEPNLAAYWTFDDGPVLGITELTAGATKVAAGQDYSLILRSNGTVLAWGVNGLGQCAVPPWLSGVVDIAAGRAYALALRNDGSVVTWGWNPYGQANVPLNNGVALAASGDHSLALRKDGTVFASGCYNAGQATVPNGLQNRAGDPDVVAIAAGAQHNLALKANGSVRAWGWNGYGQTNIPSGLNNVVAVAAGENHSLALQADGKVVAWGWNAFGQSAVPPAATNGVVAIAANMNHSLAIKADGTVVAWGCNACGETNLPSGLANVVAMAAGGRHNVFLTAQSSGNGGGGLQFVVGSVPTLVATRWLDAVATDLRAELVDLAGTLHDKADALTGAKMLLQNVLELGMPYTMERDDVLHGFFYGSEALMDLDLAKDLFTTETNKLWVTPNARPLVIEEATWLRLYCFATRLNARLQDLQATGQPEIPRMIGHTLRLLNLLRDSWTQPTNSPPPALEVRRQGNSPCLLLYGEPYMRYTLQYRDNLSVPGWTTTTITNLQDEQIISLPFSGASQRFYRTMLPMP